MTSFSVIVPLFNKAEFIVDTVSSILTQEIRDLEIIVIDDGSTDDGVQRLAAIVDPRLKVIRQPNGGVSVARNEGITQACGMFICFLDADDLWAADHLSKIDELIKSDPDAIAWATGYSEIDYECGSKGHLRRVKPATTASGRYDQVDFLAAWSRFPFLWTGSIAVRGSTLRAMQPCFPPGEGHAEDQDLWFRLAEHGVIRFLDVRTTAFYRRNVNNSLTAAHVLEPLPTFQRLAQRARLLPRREKIAANQVYSVHLLNVAWANCQAGRRTKTLKVLLQVSLNFNRPFWLRIFVCTLLPVGIVRAGLKLLRQRRRS